jgi:predicted SnoaL-like aldol condensation-catalyzing enzyme
MSAETNRQLVVELWQRLGRFDFAGAGELLHDAYVCEWPQSQERIRGRENFVALNANYPGCWAAEVQRVIAQGDQAASEVKLTWEEQSVVVVSFYDIRDGKIYHEIDYWPEPYAAPDWRAQWVERM